MLYLSDSYAGICRERAALIQAYEHYHTFLGTFKDKAIADALITMKKQHASRVELDAYGTKLGQMEEKKLKYLVNNCRSIARSPGPSEQAALEKELTVHRSRFQDAKQKYQQLSTSLIDKSGLLILKKNVDFEANLRRIREGIEVINAVHDSFNRGRIGKIPDGPIPDEETIDPYVIEHGANK
jgi:hypothetical protein